MEREARKLPTQFSFFFKHKTNSYLSCAKYGNVLSESWIKVDDFVTFVLHIKTYKYKTYKNNTLFGNLKMDFFFLKE